MFTYTIVYSEISDFDGSHQVESFSTDSRQEALDWMGSDRLMDMQVSMHLPVAKTAPSAYDSIAF